MPHATINTLKENGLLAKIERLPVLPRKRILIRQFRDPDARVLLWLHGVTRNVRHFAMQCETLEDGTREVTFKPSHGANKAILRHRPKRHFRDPFTGRILFR